MTGNKKGTMSMRKLIIRRKKLVNNDHSCCGNELATTSIENNGSDESWKVGRRLVEWDVLLDNLKYCKKCKLGPVPLTINTIQGELQKGLGGYLYVKCENPDCEYINRAAYGKTYHQTAERRGMSRFAVNTKLGTGMVKGHYVDKSMKRTCTGCQKQFKLKRKPKHCRRCGEVFCLKCVKYRRKLNILANPDPEGKIRKVCKECFEGESLILGRTNSLTDEFSKERSLAKCARVIDQRVNSLTTTFWPDEIDRQAECIRLLTGFQQEAKHLGSVNALQPLKVKLKTPAWQKSKYWDIEIQATKCRSCKGDVGLRKSSGNCRVCGLALCRKCSHKELLLFFENGDITAEARLAIIHVPGAPSHEPDISLLLYVCLDCKTYISQQQQSDLLWYTCGVDRGIVDDLIEVDDKFKDMKWIIEASIQKVEELTDKVSCRELSSPARNASAEIMTLRTTLNMYEKEIKRVRSWFDQTLTRTETTLLENYIKSRYEFYKDHRYKCRTLGNKLDAGRNRDDA
ncbi:uncharacterized protein LOC123536767 isoform X2 [Mercenaria mercenaria]|uniref:uncharacterized protein LOC123536767 isoform X2 n=1 Tax=Mercenaria mercenaria TaxID=6596 RepID=UPI00234F9364|nr:uncharacterized protein LOC123536767 isoform X2 [Mercenaria mercenaria]